MTHYTYQETQRFNQIWLWVLLIIVSILMIIKIPIGILNASSDEPLSAHEIISIVLALVFVIGLNGLFYILRLKTKINEEGISFTYRPFINKPKVFKWENIQKAYVRKYQPIWEYGGWGIKYGIKGTAYNTSGNKGLQLILKSGKKILIGTQKPKELEEFLKKYINTSLESF